MQAGAYCVAGWCAESGQMVRPLPNGQNWTESQISSHGVAVGARLSTRPQSVQRRALYPHRTEDLSVDPASILVSGLSRTGLTDIPSAATIAEAFEGHVASNRWFGRTVLGAYVPAGTQTRSLAAVTLQRSQLYFVERDAKLRVRLDDGSARYILPVSSRGLKSAWREGGIQALYRSLPRDGRVDARLGLARPFADEMVKCYLMVNGVYW